MRKSIIKTISVGFTLAVAGAWLAPASAQYVGPTAKLPSTTVAQVLQTSKDDDRVSLRGQLIRQESHEKYMFSDGSGEIRVEIDDKILPQVAVDEKTTVRLNGKVDKDKSGKIKIDVKTMEVLK